MKELMQAWAMDKDRRTTLKHSLTTAQIGRCGELLVQYRLLLSGIESAPLSTDRGVDLVAYAPSATRPRTIQIKANLQPKPGGGKGKLALDCWVPEDSPAELFAFVDLSSARIWLLSLDELTRFAQQRSSGRLHFYMYVDQIYEPKRKDLLAHARAFESFLLEHRALSIFGV